MRLPVGDQLAEDLPDALIVTDIDGIIRIWNSRAESIFLLRKEDALDKSLDIIIPEHLRMAHWQGFNRAVAENSVKHSSRPMRTKVLLGDGSKAIMEMAFSLSHDDNGQLNGVIAIARLPI